MVMAAGCFVVSELLTYIKFYRNCANITHLKTVVLNFYSSTEISQAKALLMSKFPSLINTNFCTGRRGSSSRPQHLAELDDLLGAFDFIDSSELLKDVNFVAENLDRLPKYGPEELNVCAVVDRQRATEADIAAIASRVIDMEEASKASGVSSREDLVHKLTEFDEKMSVALATLSAQVQNTNATLSVFADRVDKVRGPPVRSAHDADCSLNIIMTGVAEDRDPLQWRAKVDDVLQFVAGRPVDVVDIMRVGGRYRDGRVRPILVKLKSVWDRRILLMSRRNLKDYNSARIFLYPDEPVDVRRRQTLDRLKHKAESEGKQVVVANDSLSVDGVVVFTLSGGYVRDNN
jgi:hypothetical protein